MSYSAFILDMPAIQPNMAKFIWVWCCALEDTVTGASHPGPHLRHLSPPHNTSQFSPCVTSTFVVCLQPRGRRVVAQGEATEVKGTVTIGQATAPTLRLTASRHGTPAALAAQPAHVTGPAPSGTGPGRAEEGLPLHPRSQPLACPSSVCHWRSLSPPCGGNLLWVQTR